MFVVVAERAVGRRRPSERGCDLELGVAAEHRHCTDDAVESGEASLPDTVVIRRLGRAATSASPDAAARWTHGLDTTLDRLS